MRLEGQQEHQEHQEHQTQQVQQRRAKHFFRFKLNVSTYKKILTLYVENLCNMSGLEASGHEKRATHVCDSL